MRSHDLAAQRRLALTAVLTVVHTERNGAVRVISFRHTSEKKWEKYDVWLENKQHDA